MNFFSNYKSDIVLGERYLDEQTGMEGVATAIHFFQHACERVTLEKVKTDGDIIEITFDAPRLKSLKTHKVAQTQRTGGPARPGERREVKAR